MTFADRIKEIPIIEYANRIGFRVVKIGKYYSIKEHDSVRIDEVKNCFWRNSSFSKGYKGGAGSIIDFALEFGGYTEVKDVMRDLANEFGLNDNKTVSALKKIHVEPVNETVEFILPSKANSNTSIINYLKNVRKIQSPVIEYLINEGYLYTESKYKNCVFVNRDKDFACMRSSCDNYRFVGDVEGSNYEKCFFIKGNSKTLIVAESAIDIMSLMTLILKNGCDYKCYNYLALSGTNKIEAIFNYTDSMNISTLILAFDNDEAGLKADYLVRDKLCDSNINIVSKFPEKTNDWNDELKRISNNEESV